MEEYERLASDVSYPLFNFTNFGHTTLSLAAGMDSPHHAVVELQTNGQFTRWCPEKT